MLVSTTVTYQEPIKAIIRGHTASVGALHFQYAAPEYARLEGPLAKAGGW
jgi:hypothetical protein